MSLQTLPSSANKTYEHLVYRFAFCGAVLIFGASAIWFLRESKSNGYPIALLPAVPCCFFYVLTALNAMMFPWRYSVFGPDRKTPRPPGQPVVAFQNLGGRIGRCRSSFVALYFFPEGVAISTGIGDAWIPFTLVRRVTRRGKRIVIVHDCQEIRSPIEIATAFMAADRVDAIYRFLDESMGIEVAKLAAPSAVPMRQRPPAADDWKKSVLSKIMAVVYRIVRVVFALALAGSSVYGATIEYGRHKFIDVGFLVIFAAICLVIAGLTIWWGIPGHEWSRMDDERD